MPNNSDPSNELGQDLYVSKNLFQIYEKVDTSLQIIRCGTENPIL